MRDIVLVLGAGMFLAVPVAAEDAEPQAVIEAQIEAFQSGDLTTAFSFASPFIRQQFGTPQSFGAMVREGYPMVWRPAEVTFLAPETRAGRLWQPVMIRDGDGRLFILDYEMIQQDGAWKINGVRPRSAEGTV